VLKALIEDQDHLAVNPIAAGGGRADEAGQATARELEKLPKVEGNQNPLATRLLTGTIKDGEMVEATVIDGQLSINGNRFAVAA
jgi:hypothetical protein